ncbi:MAG: signal transduction protein [Thermoplasmata archaeon]|nr:MAG: signal transduction protein [Thermoplasmata archaeon]
MFLDTLEGLSRIFRGDIKPPKVILVTGPPGSLKSSFVYMLFSKYLKNRDEVGLYCTLEESVASHLTNMESLGVELIYNMQIIDFSSLRREEEEMDYLEFLKKSLVRFKEKYGEHFTLFALDSLGALYSIMEDDTNLRKRMYHFFQFLRELNLFSFLIMERDPDSPSQFLGNESYLSDGIIYLGMKNRKGQIIRFIQIEKMRTVEHSMAPHAITVRKGDISILGEILD